MFMKQKLYFALMTALVLSLSMSVTSCKDDDDDNNERTPEEIAQDPYEKESEAADALYRLVSQLSVCDSLPNNWKTATFEPKAGKVLDQSQPRVRTIAVNNAAEAVARYNSLTGKELPATTMSDTYKVDGVGTLQLNLGGAGTIATIDVDVKQMPQLAQLRLVSAADMGENGSFKGEPYYRFGDVVMDKDGCYWICVRPAYSPNGKEDTHWMSFQSTNKNIKTYTKKGYQPQKYPVDLGVQKEKMQYLAQLMAILANPNGYKEAAGEGNYFNGTGLGGLQEAAMPVDDLVTQAKLWKQYKVWEKVMPVGLAKDDAENFRMRFKNNLNFIYEKGSTSGKNLTIKFVQYTGSGTFYRNEPDYSKAVINMQDEAFDITESFTTHGLNNFDNNLPNAFVVRYKTGYQLSSNLLFNPSATDSIPGVTTIHRFNDSAVGYTTEEAKPKMIMAKDGYFYKSEDDCSRAGSEPVALVVYVGDDADDTGYYRGLAMSYREAKKDNNMLFQWAESDAKNELCIKDTLSFSKYFNLQKDGITRTKKLCADGHNHPAAKMASEFKVDGFDPASYDFSGWFLPTAGQILMAVKGLGGTYTYESLSDLWYCDLYSVEEDLKNAGITTFYFNSSCWTSTELKSYGNVPAIYFNFTHNMFEQAGLKVKTKTDEDFVRPFIAF